MKTKLIAIMTVLCVWTTTECRAQLVINELMQSNVDCIMDDLNDFPDSWVELYNAGTTDEQLSNYKLGKNDKPKKAWQLPTQTVKPGEYVVVYCDKAEDGLHTSFRLESGKGGEVYLFKGSDIADQLTEMKKQPAPNIAYGRKTDGADTWGYQLTPTPGAANCGQTTKNILGEPVFSEQGRVLTTSRTLSVSITLPEDSPDGTQIRYTTDGTEPTETSTLYTAPLTVSSTRIVRAKLFCTGWLSPRSTVQSYIYFPTSRKLTLPVISIVTNRTYLYDSKIGIYSDSYTNGKHNYEYNWRRPVNIEYFETAGENSQLNQLCETRIMGGATRGNKFKSLAVYANKRFGTKRLEYEFFPDQKPGLTDFKSIALRNAGNDFDYLYMRDAIIQRTMAQNTDLDWQAWRPAIIYINGTYSGILNIRERSNEDHIYTNYEGLEDIDMFENWYELKEGTWDNYNQFRAFYEESGHTLAEYAERMDWEEFINLMLMNLYYNNQDFPGNNIVMWRPTAEGGKWRWIAKDTDFGLGLYGSQANYNTIEWLYDNSYDSNRDWGNKPEHTLLFRHLMDDADFRREFIDRAAIYMGDFMNEKGTRAIWDPMYNQIKTEYPYHRALINQWWPDYNTELFQARNWLSQRTNLFYKYVANYYGVGTPTPLTINASNDITAEQLAGTEVRFNGVKLTKAIFNGKFYQNRDVTLQATAVSGKEVKGWEVTTTDNSGQKTTKQIDGTAYNFQMPACKQLDIKVLWETADGISTISADRSTATDAPIYTLQGRRVNGTLNTLPKGIYIQNGRKIVKK